MEKKQKRKVNSALLVVAAMVGTFGSRYVDVVMKWSFPLDILGLIGASLFLWWIIYSIWGKYLD